MAKHKPDIFTVRCYALISMADAIDRVQDPAASELLLECMVATLDILTAKRVIEDQEGNVIYVDFRREDNDHDPD